MSAAINAIFLPFQYPLLHLEISKLPCKKSCKLRGIRIIRNNCILINPYNTTLIQPLNAISKYGLQIKFHLLQQKVKFMYINCRLHSCLYSASEYINNNFQEKTAQNPQDNSNCKYNTLLNPLHVIDSCQKPNSSR